MHLDIASLLLTTLFNTDYNLLPFKDMIITYFQINLQNAQIQSHPHFRQILGQNFFLNFKHIVYLYHTNLYILNDQ